MLSEQSNHANPEATQINIQIRSEPDPKYNAPTDPDGMVTNTMTLSLQNKIVEIKTRMFNPLNGGKNGMFDEETRYFTLD
jgi:hypothetical protein